MCTTLLLVHWRQGHKEHITSEAMIQYPWFSARNRSPRHITSQTRPIMENNLGAGGGCVAVIVLVVILVPVNTLTSTSRKGSGRTS